MNCAISQQQQERFGTQVFRDLLGSIENQQPFDLKGYMQGVYNQVKAVSNDDARAVDYARLVPFFVNQMVSAEPQVGQNLRDLGLNMETLYEVFANVSDEENGVSAAKAFLGINQDIIRDLSEDNQEVEGQEVEEETPEIPTEVQVPANRFRFTGDTLNDLIPKMKKDFWKAFAPTALADRMQESLSWDINSPEYNVADPAQAFYFKAKRNVLRALNKANVDYDSSKLQYGGYDGVFLTAMSIEKIDEADLRPDTDLSMDPERKGVVLVLTDKYGMPIRLDEENAMPTLDPSGRISYYYMRDTSKNIDADGNITLTKTDKNHIKAMAKVRKISIDAATKAYEREIRLLHDTRQFILEDKSRNEVRNIINGGSLGIIQKDFNLKTPLKQVNLAGQAFSKFSAQETDPTKGQIAGRTYFTVDEMYGELIEIERPTVKESGFAEKLASLIVDPLVDEAGVPISPAERQKHLDMYFMTSAEGVRLFPDRDNPDEYVVKLKGTALDLSTPEGIEDARAKVLDFFNNLGPVRKIQKEEVDRQQQQRQARNQAPLKVIDASQPNFKSQYEVNAIVRLPVEGKPDQYYKIDMPKLHLKDHTGNFNDFEITNGVLTRQNKSHNEWVKENFLIQYPLNAENQLVKMNAYFTFEPTEAEINKIYGTEQEVEETVQEIEETPEETSLTDNYLDIDNPDDLFDRTNEDDEELNKLVGQKRLNKDVTKAQIKAAKKWYEASPLSKHLPFETMFNMVNSKNPNSIATWAVHGITLYQGADYTDLYHEAWHGFTQLFLTKDQKKSLYNEVRKKSGSFKDFRGSRVSFRKATDLQLEEYLAEDFRSYMLGRGKTKKNSPVRNNIFQRIFNFLKSLFTHSTSQEIAINDRADKTINELYEKLRVGNLNEYTFNAQNATFGTLNSGIQAFKEGADIIALSYEDSSQILSMVDSLFSEFTDKYNSGLNASEMDKLSKLEAKVASNNLTSAERKDLTAEIESLKSKKTYKYTTAITKSPAQMGKAYKYVRGRMANIHNAMVDRLATEENPVTKARLQKDINLLRWTVHEFGDVKNMSNNKFKESADIKGVIGYHMFKSKKFFGDVVDILDFENMSEEDTFVKGREGYDRAGNETSFLELAKPEVLYLLKGLHKVDENNKVVTNRFGVPELAPFQEIWNRLARTLQNTTRADQMYDKLLDESVTYPPFKQLLGKLGPVQTGSTTEGALWTNFWQTFNLTRIPLIQMTVEKAEGTYESRIGEAFADYRKVGRRWQSEFHQTDHETSKYVLNDAGGNYLNLKAILEDFRDDWRGKEFEFMRALGINLTDVSEIRAQISEPKYGISYFMSRLKYLNHRGDIKVRNFSDLIKNYDATKIGDRVYEPNPGLNKRFKSIQELEARYSDQVSNFMVTNAEGNTQFEHSLNNTLTMMINTLNDTKLVPNYKALVKLPYMQHLDVNRNPFAKASTWLNSLFVMDVDPSNPTYGVRRMADNRPGAPAVKLQLSNLSGVLLTEEGSETADGIAAAKADEVTKLILDFHLMSQVGIPELMRHADKGTSFSASLTSIQTPEGSKNRYVETTDFLAGSASYHRLAMDIIMPHIQAELERIEIMRDMAAGQPANFDFNYMKRGQNFVAFDDVLSGTTKEGLIALVATGSATAEEAMAQMRQEIFNDSMVYFDEQVADTKAALDKHNFLADNLLESAKRDAFQKTGTRPNNIAARDALIKSFVYNSWIHNIESIAMLYGDMAQYNHLKEEFHKRNAGAGSTGRLYRTDQAMQDLINNTLGKGYAEKNKEALGLETITGYDGTMNTAVIQDSEIGSAYYDEYLEAIGDKEAASAYSKGKMNEGDAQGWITFDSYRILKTAEGAWTSEQESLYQRIINNEEVRPQDVAKFFPTVKAQYFGPLKTDEGLPIMAFHKFSLFPLIPSVIKNTNLEKLHNKMVREGVDYALFESGSKVGTITKDGKADVGYKKGREVSDVEFTPNTIFVEYLKDQLEIAPKYKGNVIFSTQLRKLIEDGLYQQGKAITPEIEKIIKRYEANIRELTEKHKKKLLKEANWVLDENGKPTGNIEDLMKFVKNELTRQDLADHEIDFIQVHDGQLKYDLSLSLSAEKIEKLLNSIVTKRLVKQKVNGEGLVQVSGAMFESNASMEDRNYTNPTEEDLKKWGTNDLPTYHKGADGKTMAMKVKIALQGDFMRLLHATHNDGERIRTLERLNEMVRDEEWLNKDNNRRKVTMVAVRIPVQGLNSMEFMEVYEFLPAEAGNVIVPPAEIVAKSGSDFDIDKLTVMMPNLKSGGSLVGYTQQELKEKYDRYKEARIERERVGDEATNRLIEAIFGEDMTNIESEIEEMLIEEGELKTFEEFRDELIGTKALENDLIWDIKSILELPQNYATLIRPNGTEIVEPIAQDLAQYVMDFNPKDTIHGEQRETDGKKHISPTRALEIKYNLYKHSSNNIGKQTLGLGAVDNTYNAVFNRIGAHMNPTVGISTKRYNSLMEKQQRTGRLTPAELDLVRKYKVQRILMPHNSVDVDGEKAISLSHIKDSAGEHKISDVINQLLNGWLDIAKDAWIFNLQGNKETTPSLLFLIQAGVPVKQAIYFVSMPLVRQYVAEQRLAKSTFAEPLGKAPSNPLYFRTKAREEMLTNPKYGFNVGAEEAKYINSAIKNLSEKIDGEFNTDDMYNTIKGYSKATKAGKTYEFSQQDRDAFIHFLEIEEMSKAVRDIKLKLNFDTSKSGTLFEAQNRIMMEQALRYDARIPTEIIDKILEDSPIGSFYIQPFQLEVWKDAFELRNHSGINNFLLRKMNETEWMNEVRMTFGASEVFANEFRNDLNNFIFQNALHTFDINKVNSYRGYELSEDATVEQVTNLRFGAFVKDGILYYDKKQLKEDFRLKKFKDDEYAEVELPDGTKTGRGLAKVSSSAFNSPAEYFRFVFERETLRANKPYDSIKDTMFFKQKRNSVAAKYPQKQDESAEDYKTRMNKFAYETYLRDQALDNTFNHWKLFKSQESFADEFHTLRTTYPGLKEDYALVRQLSVGTSRIGFTNLKLNDTNLDGDMLNLLHENLADLSNSQVMKVDDPVENERISDFFRKFSVVAFLQAGMSTKGQFALTRIASTETFLRLMEQPVKEFISHLNAAEKAEKSAPILEIFYELFLTNNSMVNRQSRIRGKNYVTDFTLDMSKQMLADPKLKLTDVTERYSKDDPFIDPMENLHDYEGRQNIKTYDGSTLTTDSIINFLNRGSNAVLVYNLAVDNQNNATVGDHKLFEFDSNKVIGLPTQLAYAGGAANQYITDVEGAVNPRIKSLIDSAIEDMKARQDAGDILAFNTKGYGQYMIQKDRSGNMYAPQTFLYLSQQLYEKLGFINPNYLASKSGRNVVQSTQPITDQDVQDFMNHCIR